MLAWSLIGELLYVVTRVLGGIDSGDSFEVTVPSWAIAHGSLACAFPSGGVDGNPLGAPLYAFLTAGPEALLRIGHSVAFPSASQLGRHCAGAASAIVHWALFANVTASTLQLSYVAPVALAIGAVILVRATGRGGRVWEPATVALLVLAAPVMSAFVDYFHPQDLLALGLILAALGVGVRGHWGIAGALLAFAFTSQQFAVLAVAPLVVILVGRERWRFLFGLGAVLLPASAALDAVSSSSALRVLLLGSDRITLGANLFTPHGGTVLWEVHLHGAPLFLITRAAPIVASIVLARVIARRRPDVLADPVLVVSLVGVSLALRLVFEVNLFGYYFAASAVLLVVLEVLEGRLRAETLAWLSLSGVAFFPAPQSATTVQVAYVLVIAVAVLARILHGLWHRHAYWGAIAYATALIIVNTAFTSPFVHRGLDVPSWAWQVILVPAVIGLLARPLIALVRPSSALAR